MHGTTGNVLLNVRNLPHQHFAVLTGACEEVVAVVRHRNRVYRVLVLVERCDKSALKSVLRVRIWALLAFKLISDSISLHFVRVHVAEVRQDRRLERNRDHLEVLVHPKTLQHPQVDQKLVRKRKILQVGFVFLQAKCVY